MDVPHQLLINPGAKSCWAPEDTSMYEEMRFSCVDDPFGVRIDVYCPLESSQGDRFGYWNLVYQAIGVVR